MKDTRLLHVDSEFGKIVVNECLKRGYEINTQKLEKLLVIMHGKMLAEYDTPLLKSHIIPTEKAGVMIPQIDKDFIMYGLGFEEELEGYILMLENQEKVIKQTLATYGELDVFDLITKTSLKSLNDHCLKKGYLIIPDDVIKTAFSGLIWLDEEKTI